MKHDKGYQHETLRHGGCGYWSENQSVYVVTTICHMQCETSRVVDGMKESFIQTF